MRRPSAPIAFLLAALAVCGLWLWHYAESAVVRTSEGLMLQEVAHGRFSGAVLVSRAGHVLFERAYGLADAEWRVPNTIHTKFEVGSITKTFTAALVMQLEQEHKLALGDSICVYIDVCPDRWRGITLKDLLSHTSGIHNITDAPDLQQLLATPQTRAQILARMQSVPLAFAPGAKFQYSNSNYHLLGWVIEKVTRQTYEQALQRRILTPLGMRDTGFIHRDAVLAQRASGYYHAPDGTLRSATPMHESWSYAAGAIYSTVEDLEKWSRALEDGHVLPPAVLERMWHGVQGSYGYGWQLPAVSSQTLNRHLIEHGGHNPGFVAFLSIAPAEQVTVVVLSNDLGSHPPRIGRALLAAALDVPYTSTLEREPVNLAPATLARYTGEYDLDGERWLIAVREGRLFAQPAEWHDEQPAPQIELLAESDTTFFSREFEGDIVAVLDPSGHVTGLILSGAGEGRIARKVH